MIFMAVRVSWEKTFSDNPYDESSKNTKSNCTSVDPGGRRKVI